MPSPCHQQAWLRPQRFLLLDPENSARWTSLPACLPNNPGIQLREGPQGRKWRRPRHLLRCSRLNPSIHTQHRAAISLTAGSSTQLVTLVNVLLHELSPAMFPLGSTGEMPSRQYVGHVRVRRDELALGTAQQCSRTACPPGSENTPRRNICWELSFLWMHVSLYKTMVISKGKLFCSRFVCLKGRVTRRQRELRQTKARSQHLI